MEVPDRLPFEVAERLFGGAPNLQSDHHLQAPLLVMATKGSGTVRPFVRLAAEDHLLYQALVDKLAPAIEGALPPRDRVFAYRQTVENDDDQFAGTPRWSDFAAAARAELQAEPGAYCLRADVSGYFLQVDPGELERGLLETGGDPQAARDLAELLLNWRVLGIRGLPQGIPASSPLGNFYLLRLDEAIARVGVRHLRYMDDMWVFTESFSQARRIQDVIERFLYPLGLALSGEKSRIERRETSLADVQDADAIVGQRQERFRANIAAAVLAEDPYADEDAFPEPREIDAAAVLDLYREVVNQLRADQYPPLFRPTLREIYRELRSARRPDVLGDIPELLTRFPDLTGDAMAYAAYVAEADGAGATNAFVTVLTGDRFHREQELLQICRWALYLPPSEELAANLGELALTHEHALVRARALLAWGALSPVIDFSRADEFWREAERPWRAYPLVAIQDKDEAGRDARYAQWSGAGRLLDRLGRSIREERFSWRRV
jgi:hypothetical protein